MKAILLAGGYAKRMWPLTFSRPKALLDIAGRPIIDYILEKLDPLRPDNIYVSTNEKFAREFQLWLKKKSREDIEIVVEDSTSEDNKLGSLGALNFLIESKSLQDDLLIIAGDNVFQFSLSKFVWNAKNKGEVFIGLYDIGDAGNSSNFGVVQIGQAGKITGFEEKPSQPKSSLISTAIYYIPKKDVSLIKKYLSEGNKPDSPGYFISWLHKKQDIFGHIFREKWFDIGTIEAYEKAKKEINE